MIKIWTEIHLIHNYRQKYLHKIFGSLFVEESNYLEELQKCLKKKHQIIWSYIRTFTNLSVSESQLPSSVSMEIRVGVAG